MDDAFIVRRAVSLRISRLEGELKQIEDELHKRAPIRQLLTQSKDPLFTAFLCSEYRSGKENCISAGHGDYR